MTGWSLDYAPHLGFPGPDNPWFLASEGLDPVRQIERAAREGFRWVSDNGLMLRPAAERARIAAALRANGVGFSSFVDHPNLPPARWTDESADAVEETGARLSRCLEVGNAVGARFLTVVALDDGRPADRQIEHMAANLARAAPMARDAGITLALEPVNPHRLAGVLVTEVDRAARLLDLADEPALLKSFDIEHVRYGNGDLIAAWDRVRRHVGLVQIADRRRGEPGSGDAPIAPFLRHIAAGGYSGVVELEHRHSRSGIAGEQASLARLRAIDAMVIART